MKEQPSQAQQLANEALNSEEKLKSLIANLKGKSRRERQNAASALAIVAKANASLLADYTTELNKGLNAHESQTRWECLDIFTCLVPDYSRSCEKALAGAENALFDEESGFVRLAAMRFLCAYGATTKGRSEKCWPLIDEAIQCYHGDDEFNDMLNAITEFAGGKIDKEVKEALIRRFTFDATSGKGSIKRKAQDILKVLE